MQQAYKKRLLVLRKYFYQKIGLFKLARSKNKQKQGVLSNKQGKNTTELGAFHTAPILKYHNPCPVLPAYIFF